MCKEQVQIVYQKLVKKNFFDLALLATQGYRSALQNTLLDALEKGEDTPELPLEFKDLSHVITRVGGLASKIEEARDILTHDLGGLPQS